MTFLMPNVVLLFVYFSGQSPHHGLTVTSFRLPSCHSNEEHHVWQIDQTVGKQDADGSCLHVLSPTSIGDQMTLDPAVDPGHND